MGTDADIPSGAFEGMKPGEIALIALGYYEALLLGNDDLRDAYGETYGEALADSWLMLTTGLLMLLADEPGEMYEVIDKARAGLIELNANT